MFRDKRIRLVTVLMLLGAVGATGYAAPGITQPKVLHDKSKWRLPKYYDQLDLTDEQKDQVTKVVNTYDDRIKELNAQLQAAPNLLLAKTIKNMLNDRRAALERILTEAQREKLKQLKSAATDDTGKSTKAEPLTEAALIKLVDAGIEDDVILAQLKKLGVGFKVDDATLKRLKKAGVSDAVLAGLQPAQDASKPAPDDDKPLATAKTGDGLIVEVLEVKPTKNELLLIRWRYRNPTKKNIQLIAPTPQFRVSDADSPPNIAKKFFAATYFVEGKETDSTTRAYRHPVLHDEGNPNKLWAKDVGKAAVVIRPDQEYELWAHFHLPVKKTEKTISLMLWDTPVIKDIPIQSPEQ
jgi:Spy/CpxP family protein refolding chaperone